MKNMMIVGAFCLLHTSQAAVPLLDRPLVRRDCDCAHTRSIASDTPWPTPTHIVASARLPPCLII